MQLRIAGETQLKSDVKCPYCKRLAKRTGKEIEIVVDESTGLQYAHFRCDHCKEEVLIR